jgi:phosphatidylinositol alpha-mannosyltransferase
MKIGLVCPYNLYKSGGVQECVLSLYSGLSKNGHEVLIITPYHRSMPAKLPNYVRLIGRSARVSSFQTTAQVSISVEANEVKNLMDKEKFDILHFHEPWIPLLASQMLLAKGKSKHVATFHAKLPETVLSNTIKKVITPYTRSTIKKLDALTAVSEAAAEYVSKLTKKPIMIIPNGVDVKKFNVEHASSQPNILFVGRLEKRKGVKYLLKAFELLSANYPKINLIIAGDGPYRQRLEDEAGHLDLKNVKFLGHVSEAKKLKLLSKADLFCSPAIHGESFGIVLLEALAANVPIVAADNPGYKGVLVGPGLISLINVKDKREFARRLEMLLFDEKLRASWQAWAKSYINQFDYSAVVGQYEKLYKKVLKI